MTLLQQAISRRAAMKQILDGYEKFSVLNPTPEEAEIIRERIMLLHEDIEEYNKYIEEMQKAVD